MSPGVVVSNRLEIRIADRDAAWEKETIDRARTRLDACDTILGGSDVAISLAQLPPDEESACRQLARALRFLSTREAVDAMLNLLGRSGGRFDLHFTLGLVGATDRQYVRRKLEGAIDSPNIGLDAGDLVLMAVFALADRFKDHIPIARELTPEMETLAAERRTANEELLRRYARRLAGALPGKQPWAAKRSYYAVQAYAPEAAAPFAYLVEEPTPSPGDLAQLPARTQHMWLNVVGKWRKLDHAAMLPAILKIAEQPPSAGDGPKVVSKSILWQAAIARLHSLAPKEAREILEKEIQRPNTIVHRQASLLDLLPSPLPSASERLAENLEANPPIGAHLVARFADESVYDRVEAVYEQRAGRWPCTSGEHLLGYLVRARPTSGAQHLQNALGERRHTGCYRTVLSTVARYHFDSTVEALAVVQLRDADAEVAADAVRTLARHGSPAVRRTLWRRLEEWHQEWGPRMGELQRNPVTHEDPMRAERQLENSLVQALCCAVGWLAAESDLARLRRLCENSKCADYWIKVQGAPVPLDVRRGGGIAWSWHIQVGRHRFRDPKLLDQKLAQYPQGTVFQWKSDNEWPDAIDGPSQEGFRTRLAGRLTKIGMRLE